MLSLSGTALNKGRYASVPEIPGTPRFAQRHPEASVTAPRSQQVRLCSLGRLGADRQFWFPGNR